MDGEDPPQELLESLYDEIISNEIKIKAVGDPDKQGWVKKIDHGKEKEVRESIYSLSYHRLARGWFSRVLCLSGTKTRRDLKASCAAAYCNQFQ